MYKRQGNNQPVVVTLDNGGNDGTDANNDGFGEEQDSVGFDGDVEGIEGGSGDDTLTGNGSRNTLTGGLGRDRLRGLAGDDVLRANDGVQDLEIACGADFDTAMIDSQDGAFPADCEGGSNTPKDKPAPVLLSKRSVSVRDGGSVLLRVRCPSKARGGRCEGTLKLVTTEAFSAGALLSASGQLEIGSSRYDLKAGDEDKVRVDISKRGRALVKERKDLLVEATATETRRDSRGRQRSTFTTLHLLRSR